MIKNLLLTYLKLKGFNIIGSENKKGYLTYGKTTGEPLAIVSIHKAVITPNTFLKVNRLLDEKHESYFKKNSKIYWLSGIMKCPFCDGDYILCNSGKNTYYVCSNRLKRTSMGLNQGKDKCENNKYVNAEKIEKKVEEYIFNLRAFTSDMFNQVYESNTKETDNTLELTNKIKENDKLINNLVEKLMYLSNEASLPVTNKIEEITGINSQLKIKLENEKLRLLELEVNKVDKKHVFNNICAFGNLKDNSQKRIAIKEIFKFIVYDPFKDVLEVEFP